MPLKPRVSHGPLVFVILGPIAPPLPPGLKPCLEAMVDYSSRDQNPLAPPHITVNCLENLFSSARYSQDSTIRLEEPFTLQITGSLTRVCSPDRAAHSGLCFAAFIHAFLELASGLQRATRTRFPPGGTGAWRMSTCWLPMTASTRPWRAWPTETTASSGSRPAPISSFTR